MLAVRPVSREPCGGCDHHSCTSNALRSRLDGRSCPSLLNPARLDRSTDCLICGQCIKSCTPDKNMSLFLRRPYHSADSREHHATWIFTLFAMLLSGFVVYELCTEWTAAKTLFLTPANAMAGWIGLDESDGWVKGFWLLFLFPALLWSLLGAMVLAARGANSLGSAWRSLVWPLIPLIAAGHMAKGAAKVSSWIGYMPLALDEPEGIEHARAITAGTLARPQHIFSKPVVALISIGLIALFAVIAFRENSMQRSEVHRSRVLPILIVVLLEMFLVWGWAFGT